MISKKVKVLASSFAIVVLGVAIVEVVISKPSNLVLSSENQYTLNFAGKKISDATSSYEGEKSATVITALNNPITFKAANVIDNDGGWQTILPGGYFYNPIDASSTHNKISGLKSVLFTSGSNVKLSLHYGSTINNEDIIYSRKVELTANETYTFEGSPSYMYLKNEGESNVVINNFAIDYTCADSGYQKQDYKVLMIGNSFSDDTIFFANRIANSYGINLTIVDAFIANCDLATHYSNFVNSTAAYTIKTVAYGEWATLYDNVPLAAVLNYTDWDVITFQQATASVGVASSYSSLENLANGVRSIVGNGPKFDWYQTWTYDSGYTSGTTEFSTFNNSTATMFAAINSCYQSEVASLDVFDKMIPAGTVVQNARSSFLKETFTRDFKHMSSVHGRYLLGLNLVSSIFDIDLDMSPCTYIPSTVDTQFMNVAKESIKNAYEHPLAATASVYKNREVAGYNLSQYTEIDAELVGCSFWNSTDSNYYNSRQSNGSGTSNKFVSTKRFAPADLPVGSLVVIDDAFGIRPEAWVTDAKQSSRPAEMNVRVLEITSSFFSGYAYRAFNIFKEGNVELKGMYDQVFDGFHIYVPNASLGTIPPKSANANYSSDKQIMKNNLINIDAYERMHLDPITGFYHCTNYSDLTNSYVDDTAKKFMCTRPFHSADGDLPENTVIIVDEGYQWRSDAWGAVGKASSRPDNVSTLLTRLTSSFWTGFRTRTFNVSSTSSSYVGQNYISFLNHMRIYVPVSDDIDLEPEDTLTMTVLGEATVAYPYSAAIGSKISIMITVSGDSTSNVSVHVLGSAMTTTGYTYNASTGVISIGTTGKLGDYDYEIGTITGTVNRTNEKITGISINGSANVIIKNNGSIECKTAWHDRCDYATTNATQDIYQRRYGKSWSYNAGYDQWTTSNSSYHMEEQHSMGLRIADQSYQKTSFLLKNDLNSGSGLTLKHFSIWLFNPGGDFIKTFKFYAYKAASSTQDGHIVPSSTYDEVITKDYTETPMAEGEWINIQCGFTSSKVYNFSLYFEVKESCTATKYLYLAHISLL